MAFMHHSADLRHFTHRIFGAMAKRTGSPLGTPVYRCTGCGEEITFDSLSANCRCSEECYGAATPSAAVAAAGDTHH